MTRPRSRSDARARRPTATSDETARPKPVKGDADGLEGDDDEDVDD